MHGSGCGDGALSGGVGRWGRWGRTSASYFHYTFVSGHVSADHVDLKREEGGFEDRASVEEILESSGLGTMSVHNTLIND